MRVPDLDGVIEDDPVSVVDDLAFVAELEGLPRRPLRIGRAPTSWRLTSRFADSGIIPDRRLRAWATTRSVRPASVSRSLIARCSRPLRCPVAVRSARRALRITAVASRMVCSAIPASSPVMRRTAA